ncbi:hypothetical protein LWI28_017671 [Acer negundo]|uniref:Uncharacterized protein n=1 Tax=Acer negundo TaxID=4023 RepID=A0AAD5JDF1_ACENE|nr:hypothetical protein LWI28_017671 [Acer negundo]
MDTIGDHESINDINNISISLREKFQALYPISGECCIYRVPPGIRKGNEKLYTPKLVSIGPLHHGSNELQAMEEHKIRYLQHFLQRTLKISFHFSFSSTFLSFKTSMAGQHYEGLSLSQLTSRFFMPVRELLLVDINLFEIHFSEAKHFIDLLRLCLQPSNNLDSKTEVIYSPTAPSITQLHQAGVYFKLVSTKHLLDIRFSKGTLEIPILKIGSVSGYLLFGNLLVFERLHCDTNYINDYIKIISCLVNAPKDAQLLIQNGVIKNRTWEGEGMSTLLNNLCKNARVQFFNSNYSPLVEELHNYCKSPWNKWKANLKQNYFNTPWASISVIAAAILLMLTFVQAVCSILALKRTIGTKTRRSLVTIISIGIAFTGDGTLLGEGTVGMHAAQTQRHLRSTRSPSKATTGHHAKNHRRHTFAALQLEAQHAGTGNAVPRPHTPRHDNSATGESTPDNAVWFHKVGI